MIENKNDVRTFRLVNVKDGMLIIDCIDSTAYSFFTNPVYVSRTSNHLGTTSLFSSNFSRLAEKITRKQRDRSEMIRVFVVEKGI